MRRDPRAYLWDVLRAAGNAETFVHDATLESFARDALLHSAVERQAVQRQMDLLGED